MPLAQNNTSSTFRLSELFPPMPDGEHRLLPKQAEIFDAVRSTKLQGGGAVYQGGKGSGKTFCGGAFIIWVHHLWPGTDSLIGRETYPALKTSTAKEFFAMVSKLPRDLVTGHSQPGTNNMGWVEWAVGGVTYLCSLSNSDTWESGNFGAAWVDEGHRQNGRIVGDLETRLRQKEGPRVLLITTNPAGKNFAYKMAHPDSKTVRKNWLWIEASSMENPTLPQDYLDRLVDRYGLGTPAYRRWVLGQSSALEGAVFTEFVPDVEDCIHVVPAFDVPQDWQWGRGMDYGMVNPSAVVWAGEDPFGNVWVDRMHYEPQKPEDREFWSVERHAEVIRETDALYQSIDCVPSDVRMHNREHRNPMTGLRYSTADEFHEHGVDLTLADNDRESGLSLLLDLIAIREGKTHPVSLERASPSLFILDRPCNEPLITELQGLLWAKPEGTAEAGRPDDVQKKNDHGYDALRYRCKAMSRGILDRIPLTRRGEYGDVVGSRGRRRNY